MQNRSGTNTHAHNRCRIPNGRVVGVNRCKLDHLRAPRKNVCWHNVGKICDTKLKTELQRLNKLLFMCSKAENHLANSRWLFSFFSGKLKKVHFGHFFTVVFILISLNRIHMSFYRY